MTQSAAAGSTAAGSTAAGSTAAVDVDELVDDVRAGVHQVSGAVRDILTAAGRAVELLPDSAAADGLESGIGQLRRACDEATAALDRLLLAAGSPRALRAAGEVWATGVGGAVSGLAAFATLNGLRVDDHWSGPAADAYRHTLLPQSAALAAVKSACDEIDAGLTEFGNAVTGFWVEIGRAVLALVVALLIAYGAAAAPGGVVLGVAFAAAALAAFTVGLAQSLAAFGALAGAVVSRTGELDRLLSDDTAFPRGAWPTSATPLSADGSITDGDDTDWHLR